MFGYISPYKKLLKLTIKDAKEFSYINKMEEEHLDASSMIDSATS